MIVVILQCCLNCVRKNSQNACKEKDKGGNIIYYNDKLKDGGKEVQLLNFLFHYFNFKK